MQKREKHDRGTGGFTGAANEWIRPTTSNADLFDGRSRRRRHENELDFTPDCATIRAVLTAHAFRSRIEESTSPQDHCSAAPFGRPTGEALPPSDSLKDYPVTLVSSPAGSGKTTLIASYLRERRLPPSGIEWTRETAT